MRFLFSVAFAVTAVTAHAGPVSFSTGWAEQRLSLFSSNDYAFGDALNMTSDGSVSIAWTRVDQGDWGSNKASWDWSVSQSVPPTDLSLKGGDDRNISVYFVFVPNSVAPSLEGDNIRSLLGRNDVRVVQYAWGGNNPIGSVINSPYGASGTGVTIPLRGAGIGSASEAVNLNTDFDRAFSEEKGALIGLAVSGDSDDTNTFIQATVRNLNLS